MQSYRCQIYLELTEPTSAIELGDNGDAPDDVLMRQIIDLPFVPMPGMELSFGIPATRGGLSRDALEVGIHSVSYHIATGCFAVFCKPVGEFEQMKPEMDDPQRRDQIISDCWRCGFRSLPVLARQSA